MKDYSEEDLDGTRPEKTPLEAINYCLKKLLEEDIHEIRDEVSPQLTYEELIGALFHGRDLALNSEVEKKEDFSRDAGAVEEIETEKEGKPVLLKVETILEDNFDLFNAIGCDELTSDALSVPVIKKAFQQHLRDCGIEEITDLAIEAAFIEWLQENLFGSEVSIFFAIEHLYKDYGIE